MKYTDMIKSRSLYDAIEDLIKERAADIKDYIRLGWTPERAVDYVQQHTTLGPKSWERVLKLAGIPQETSS